jgi:hypothetical protein
LGVAEDDSTEEIKQQKDYLLEEYKQKLWEADDKQKFRDALEALEEIDSAWKWIESHRN